jgi:hypothetical protein
MSETGVLPAREALLFDLAVSGVVGEPPNRFEFMLRTVTVFEGELGVRAVNGISGACLLPEL